MVYSLEKSFAVIVTCGTVAAGWLVGVDGELVEVLPPQAASRLATISNMRALIQPRRLTMECMLNILETPLLFLGTHKATNLDTVDMTHVVDACFTSTAQSIEGGSLKVSLHQLTSHLSFHLLHG
jgi:hypothetical protein